MSYMMLIYWCALADIATIYVVRSFIVDGH